MKRRAALKGFVFGAGASCLHLRSGIAATPPLNLNVVVNRNNPINSIDPNRLYYIFTGSSSTWDNGNRIVVLNLPAGDSFRVAFDRVALHMNPDEVGRFWVDVRVRGNDRPPRQIPTPEFAMRIVSKLVDAITYLPVGLIAPDVKIVARIINNQVVPIR
jgi:ABC-type phosphate transport system substrate-binding protein